MWGAASAHHVSEKAPKIDTNLSLFLLREEKIPITIAVSLGRYIAYWQESGY